MNEFEMLRRRTHLEALITEREGMVALNQERIQNGLTPGYDVSAFYALAEKMREISCVAWKG